jgi:2'-5' RNA ligase
MDNPRLFAAVPLPEALKKTIAEKSAEWKKQLPFRKWTHPDDVHITLKFLGETEPTLMPELERRLSECAKQTVPFTLAIEGAGTFGKPSSPSIFWLGVGGELDALRELQACIERQTTEIGFVTEDRPYRPHITIARRFDGTGAWSEDALAAVKNWTKGQADLTWPVNEIVLYQSHLNRSPMYEPKRRWQLGEGNR